MKKVETTNTFVNGVFPNTLAIDSTGAATQDGFEYISANINNLQVGPQQAMMDYAAGNSNPDVGSVGVPNGVTEARGFSQLIEAMHKGFGIGPGVYKPWGKFDDPSVTGDRILLLSNQGVLISSFPELVAATYVGDGNNATAPFFYKSVLADGVTRDTAGPFFILPPANPTYKRTYTIAAGDFSLSGGNLASTQHGNAIPYQTSDGQWWVFLDIAWTASASAAPSTTMSGITTSNTVSMSIAQTTNNALSPTSGCQILAGGGQIVNFFSGSASFAMFLQGHVPLTGEPTFTDGHTFPLGITY